MRTPRSALLVAAVLAAAAAATAAATATFGHAASLDVTSHHLTVLDAGVTPTCPVGQASEGSCTATLLPTLDVYYEGTSTPARVDSDTLHTNPHTGGAGANFRQSFLRFSQIDDIPAAATVTSATLTMTRHTDNATSDRSYSLQPAAADWTSPAAAPPDAAGPIATASSQTTTLTWDVAAAVEEFVLSAPEQHHGWRLTDAGSGNQTTQFRASTYSADPAQRPTLTITYTMP